MPDRLDPTFVLQQIELLKLMYPDIWNAEGDRPLAFETETDLDTFLSNGVAEILRTEGEIDGAKGELAELEARKDRFERRREAIRALCLRVMTRAEVTSRKLTRATLSIRTGQPKVIITDETALPSDCIRIKREPNRDAIRKHFACGDLVPGAEMSNAEPHLTITK